jgi:hypothetical protein
VEQPDDFLIDDTGLLFIDGHLVGYFEELKTRSGNERPDLVQKHKIKAIFIGDNKFRYIARWDLVIREYLKMPCK